MGHCENGIESKDKKRLEPKESAYLAELHRAGYRDGQIVSAICKRFGRNSLDRTTVWRHRRKLPPRSDEDDPWLWERMEEYGLPWEASRVIMDCAALWTEFQADDSYPRPFTVRLAKWAYRLSCAYPDISRHTLLEWAENYARLEIAREWAPFLQMEQ